ncbi:MAG: TetM/TetW/TetO/TetS family tetracycline resistance ribosomal protection protein [Clostridia bacterium]|nr:TetM/TetW/TetO/TetS family tetracycline resistance ribosomal protection protein [Clostridia bacterium]
MITDIRNIGIFAHVDAGKTTLSERLLVKSGEIRSAGYVDSGTAHTDRLDVERRRGISVKSACAPLSWKGASIRLIDTPGHADFSSEIERGMWAIDGAILLVSAPDGIQPQTEVLFRKLRQTRIPTLIFVNKMDRNVSLLSDVLSSIRKQLSPAAFDAKSSEDMMAAIAETDEEALDAYMEGVIWDKKTLISHAAKGVSDGCMYPVYAGSALTGEGVDELLDAVVSFLPKPEEDSGSTVSGVVFAVEPDPLMGRAAYVRLFSGTLKNRDMARITVHKENEYGEADTVEERKITQIRSIGASGRGDDVGEMKAGDIAVVYGLGDVKTGQVIGDSALLPEKIRLGSIRAPLFMTKVIPESADQLPSLKRALELLAAEDPLLDVTIISGSMHVKLMGAIQLEVLKEDLLSRFQLHVDFSEPEVIYRETIKQTAVGFVAYTMPKPCWAVIKFEISPSPRGSGVTFESTVSPRQIKLRYQHQVANSIRLATRQGMLGWQVDDVHVKLIDGGDHEIHTHPLDFVVATPMAFMDALQRGGSTLLEPILEMEVTVDENGAGRIIGEMNAMRGCVLSTNAKDGKIKLLCEAPAAESADFPVRFQRITSGRGALSSKLKGYRECDLTMGKTCPRRGVHPLDTAKYILAARSALDGEIFG